MDIIKDLFERVDSEGLVSVKTDDSRLLIFTQGMLERLLENAKNSATGKVVVCIKEAAEGST